MDDSEKPPLFKSWTGWYVLVLSVLVAQVIIYRFITMVFA